jgi:hypothetical protein
MDSFMVVPLNKLIRKTFTLVAIRKPVALVPFVRDEYIGHEKLAQMLYDTITMLFGVIDSVDNITPTNLTAVAEHILKNPPLPQRKKKTSRTATA